MWGWGGGELEKRSRRKKKNNSKAIYCAKITTINFLLHNSTYDTYTDGQMNSSLKDLMNLCSSLYMLSLQQVAENKMDMN